MGYYDSENKFNVAVDCIIFGFDDEGLKILILKRNFEPAKGNWSLMGGFLQKDESIDESAARVLKELTGLTNVYMEQIGAFGEIERDPGDRVISIAYSALINIKEYDKALVEKHNAFWVKYNNIPDLVFDHDEMVKRSLKELRRKAAIQPIGFNLLPPKFTLPQLQRLYEAIYQTTLDKRNFRKKMIEMNVLENTGEKDKESSKRGAYLYRFNKEKYEQLLHEGLSFGL